MNMYMNTCRKPLFLNVAQIEYPPLSPGTPLLLANLFAQYPILRSISQEDIDKLCECLSRCGDTLSFQDLLDAIGDGLVGIVDVAVYSRSMVKHTLVANLDNDIGVSKQKPYMGNTQIAMRK